MMVMPKKIVTRETIITSILLIYCIIVIDPPF